MILQRIVEFGKNHVMVHYFLKYHSLALKGTDTKLIKFFGFC